MRTGFAVFLFVASGIASGQNAKSVLDQAAKAMGSPTSVQFGGSGAVFNVGQNVNPTLHL